MPCDYCSTKEKHGQWATISVTTGKARLVHVACPDCHERVKDALHRADEPINDSGQLDLMPLFKSVLGKLGIS